MENIKNYKITIFGDSVPKGVYIDTYGGITKLEKNAIDIISEYFNTTIINKSVFGQTLKRFYQKNVIDNYLKDIDINDNNVAVISLGGNDCNFNWQEVSLEPLNSHSSFTSETDFCYYLEYITKKLKEANVLVAFTTLFPINSKRYFENIISKNNNGDNVLKFLNNDVSNLNRHQEYFNQLICNHAKKYNCLLFDIRSSFLFDVNCLDHISLDGIHPNNSGQKLIAESIIKQIKAL